MTETAAVADEPQWWWFTFGYGHRVGPIALSNCYVRVYGEDAEARELVVAAFGTAWAFQYPSAEEAGVERFGMREITDLVPELRIRNAEHGAARS